MSRTGGETLPRPERPCCECQPASPTLAPKEGTHSPLSLQPIPPGPGGQLAAAPRGLLPGDIGPSRRTVKSWQDRTGRCHCLGRPFRIPQCPGRPHWSLATAGLARDTRPPGTKSGFLLSLVSSFFKKQQVLTYRERSISWRGWEPVRGPRLFLYPHPPGTISTPELTPPTHRTQRNSIFISDAYDG